MVKRKLRWLSVVVAPLLVTSLLPASNAEAQVVCEDLSYETVVTGEMRYRTLDGDDECYANQYYDSGDELSLVCSGLPGALIEGSAQFGTYAVHEDYYDGDASDVLFTYRVSELNAFACSTSGCTNQDYVQSFEVTWRVNSSDTFQVCSGHDCFVHAGKMLSISVPNGTLDGWESFGDVSTASGCNQDDLGCFLTDPQQCDEIIDF